MVKLEPSKYDIKQISLLTSLTTSLRYQLVSARDTQSHQGLHLNKVIIKAFNTLRGDGPDTLIQVAQTPIKNGDGSPQGVRQKGKQVVNPVCIR